MKEDCGSWRGEGGLRDRWRDEGEMEEGERERERGGR